MPSILWEKFATVTMSTDAGGIIAASDTILSGSAPNSAPNSPKNRIKFLCSHGGKILPRPPDGQLKYVGGETRVISVPGDISFQELMKKLICVIDGEVILKYQATSEDLDALITVKSDEDVRYMCDEIERCENAGTSRLRAFLFRANPITVENQMDPPLEQRYIDSINCIIRITPKSHLTIANMVQHGSLVSSSCSSPNSPDSCTTEAMSTNEPMVLPTNNYHHNGRMMSMHKVHSSPSICGSSASVNIGQQSHHYIHQLPSAQPQQFVHHYSPGPGYQSSPKPPLDLPRNERKLMSVRSVGRADGARYQMDPVAPAPAPHYYYSTYNQNRGGKGCWHYNDCGRLTTTDRRMAERTSSRAMSPVHSRIHLGPGHADNM